MLSLKEIGSKDFLVLNEIAKKINSKSVFQGEIDNQLIIDEETYNSKSDEVFDFLKINGNK